MEPQGRFHKFTQQGEHILLDVNSAAVHLLDTMTYDIMDYFDGRNDEAVVTALANKYPPAEIREALAELRSLMEAGELFAPTIDAPPTFKQQGLVKSLCLMAAQDCNLRCRYCFGSGGSYGGKRSVMSEETGKAAIDFLIKSMGPRIHSEIDFFGGEPLLNLTMIKAVTEYVRQKEQTTGKKFKLTLTTNGLLLNEETISWLNANDFDVVLSLDGRKAVHDKMRPTASGQGSYDIAVKNFRRLTESRHGEHYYLRGTYTRENLDFSQDVLAMLAAGFNTLSIEPVVLKEGPLALREADLPRIFAEYDRLTEIYLEKRRRGEGFFFFHYNVDLAGGPCVAKRLAGCGAGHEYLAVAENGDLYPCHQFVGRDKYRLGSVFTGVESDRWPAYFRQSHVLNKEKCRDCWAKFLCSGGCHANADLFNGDIRKPYEVACEIQKKRLECAIFVQAMMAREETTE